MTDIVERGGPRPRSTRQWSTAWIVLCLGMGLHVLDQVLTDFLSLWNPAVRSLRSRLPLAPLPTFTFEVWLGGLILAWIALLILSRFVLRGARWMVPLSYIFAALMLANGLLHIAASLTLGRAAPGLYSSPLLLVAAGYLISCTRRYWRPGSQLSANRSMEARRL